jgi:sulfatase modifying factor 1
VGAVLVIFMIVKIAGGSGKKETPLSIPQSADPTQPAARVADQPDLVLVTGGTFSMGCTSEQKDCSDDEKPVTRVTVNDFYMGKYAVTFDEFDAYCAATGREKPSYEGWGRGQRPVINVSWNDAAAYCNWLSEQAGLSKVYTISGDKVTADWSANGYRLPTEAEWEYAARGGGKAVLFGNGKNVADPKEINFDASTIYSKSYSVAGEYRGRTVPVGSLNSPNALSLHDMSGNALEWCWDWKAPYPGGSQNNYRGPASGSRRVCRGGSWFNVPQGVRVAFRYDITPGFSLNYLGFRLAKSAK